MKNLYLSINIVLFLILFTSSNFCQPLNDSTALSTLKKWSEAFNSKNAELTLSFISTEYIGYFPEQEDQFYETMKSLYNNIFKNNSLNVSIKYFVNDFYISNDLTVIRLVITTTAKSSFAKQPQIAKEKGTQVWRKENNSWKLYRSVTFPISNK